MRAPLFIAQLLIVPLMMVLASPAGARTIAVDRGTVGEGRVASLADAIRAAHDGDTIHLATGTYYECAIITQQDLVLEGEGADTALSDKTCEAKALLVIRGANATIRNLTLARARVPDGNGAGIRLEGQGLTLEHVRFDNNQVGLLAAQPGPGRIRIADCQFEGGGVAGDRPSAGVTVGPVAALVLERSVFTQVKGGQINTAAERSELVDNQIETGIEPGAGPAVVARAGTLMMRGNVLALGPNPPDRDAAVLAYGGAVALRGNTLENTTGRKQTMLLDWTGIAPVMDGNTVAPGDALVSSAGAWRHRAGGIAHTAIDDAHAAASAAKSAAKSLLGR